jgi:hypothetical protein
MAFSAKKTDQGDGTMNRTQKELKKIGDEIATNLEDRVDSFILMISKGNKKQLYTGGACMHSKKVTALNLLHDVADSISDLNDPDFEEDDPETGEEKTVSF